MSNYRRVAGPLTSYVEVLSSLASCDVMLTIFDQKRPMEDMVGTIQKKQKVSNRYNTSLLALTWQRRYSLDRSTKLYA